MTAGITSNRNMFVHYCCCCYRCAQSYHRPLKCITRKKIVRHPPTQRATKRWMGPQVLSRFGVSLKKVFSNFQVSKFWNFGWRVVIKLSNFQVLEFRLKGLFKVSDSHVSKFRLKGFSSFQVSLERGFQVLKISSFQVSKFRLKGFSRFKVLKFPSFA